MRSGLLRLAAGALFVAALLTAPVLAPQPWSLIPTASAACPDVEVDFARGREEGPGVGAVGQAFTNPLPPPVDSHVAAVALFGNATQKVVGAVPGPSSAFAGKIIDLCAAGDPICTGGIQDLHWHSHLQPSYIDSGLVDQAANFVAGRL
jgi:hypothetical protein